MLSIYICRTSLQSSLEAIEITQRVNTSQIILNHSPVVSETFHVLLNLMKHLNKTPNSDSPSDRVDMWSDN